MTATATEPFWRMEDPVIADDGSYERGGMWEHQREWWDLPNFVKALVTGYGGGKTLALAKRMIWLALANSPAPVMTVSPTFPLARKTIVETIDELLDGKCIVENRRREEEGLEGRMSYRFIRTQPYEFAIDLAGRSGTIWCMSGENPDRLKGPNIGAAGIDEPFIQSADVYNQVVARVRHPAARYKEINLTGTPEGVVGWGYELCEGEAKEKQDVGIVQASTVANKSLGPEYVERMEAAFDDNALSSYRDGKFANMTKGRVYHAFDPSKHIVEEAAPAGADLCIGMDFNVDPFAYVVFWRTPERIHFVAEYELPNFDAEQAAAKIGQDHPEVRRIYPDASGAQRSHAGGGGKSAHGYLRDAGFQVVSRPANPLIVDRVNAVNGGFRHGRVTLSPACRRLKTYLMAQTHKDKNTKAQKAMGHLLDAAGYPVAYLFPVDKQHTRLVTFRQ